MCRRTHWKRSPHILVSAAAFPLFVSVTFCQGTSQNLLTSGEQQLREGRSTYSIAVLTAGRANFAACIEGNQSEIVDRCYYDLARAERYLNLAELNVGDSHAAKRWMSAALIDGQHAVARNPRSADAHALLADIYGAQIDGMFSGMKYGPKANAEISEAFRLDSQNAQAWAVSGRKYLYAPPMFGGDIDKAVDAFRKATLYDSHSDENFLWLAIALKKKGDVQGARHALEIALRLDDRNVMAHHEEASLR